MAATARNLTLEEFLALPEEKPYLELIDGEVCPKQVGKTRHSRAQRRILQALASHPATRDGEAYPELGMHYWSTALANHRVPDVSYYRAGCKVSEPYPDEPPDLVVEIRSEGQSRAFVLSRLAFFRAHGVPVTLLIDPEEQSVTVDDGHEWTASGADEVVLAALDGFSFQPADLFA